MKDPGLQGYFLACAERVMLKLINGIRKNASYENGAKKTLQIVPVYVLEQIVFHFFLQRDSVLFNKCLSSSSNSGYCTHSMEMCVCTCNHVLKNTQPLENLI